MRILYTLLLPVFLIAAGSCKKPVLEVNDGTIPPLVLTTSINDSLPSKAIETLKLGGVTGLKIQYYSGLYSKYFEYEAEKGLLLETLSALPFPMNASFSDTQCRQITLRELNIIRQSVSNVELENASFFWDGKNAHVEVFECIKPPFRHTLQVAKNTNRVLHRIELLGKI